MEQMLKEVGNVCRRYLAGLVSVINSLQRIRYRDITKHRYHHTLIHPVFCAPSTHVRLVGNCRSMMLSSVAGSASRTPSAK
jgi:hypothetical protein